MPERFAPYNEPDQEEQITSCPNCEGSNFTDDTPKGKYVKLYICNDCGETFKEK